MNKDSNKVSNKKNSFSPIKYDDISEIERKVDKILLEKKDKLNEWNSASFDVKKISLKNKERESIYFLREKSKKNTEDDAGSELLSNKIISDARENLGEEPLEIDENVEGLHSYKKPKKKEVRKRIKFGGKKELPIGGILDRQPEEKKTVLSDKDLPLSKLDEIAKWAEKSEVKKDEEVKKTSIDSDIKEKKSDTEVEAVEPVEKRFFLRKKKPSKIEDKKKKDKKDIDLVLSSPDNLSELKEKYEGRLTFSDTDLAISDEIDEDEAKLLDEKISEMPSSKESVDSGKIDHGEIKIGEYEKKKFFSKRKKPSKVEEVAGEEDETESKKSVNKFKLHVENLPKADEVSEDEAKLLDEKIKEIPVTNEVGKQDEKVELEAMKLAEDHIKNNLFTEKSLPVKDEKAEETPKPTLDVSLEKKHLEHMFFDEADGSDGWNPETIKEEEKDTSLPLSARPEIGYEDLKIDTEVELPRDVLQTKTIELSDLGFSENDWEELDFYPLLQPFTYVEILREKESLDKRYFLVEVELTEGERKMLEFITETLNKITIDTTELDSKGKDKYFMGQVEQIIKDYGIRLDNEARAKIFYYLEKVSLGLGRIDPLMRDPHIEDISCDGANVPIFLYHRKYGSLKSNIEFKDEDELSSFVFRLAQKCGKHISIAEPMLDATMPDGSRIQMTLSDEITAKGSTFTIRKFREDPFSPPDLVEFNTMSAEMVAYMWITVENRVNALIAGGTASGKTTVLNALSLFIPREAKIVSIEETREINLPHPNWIPGVARSGFGEIVADKMVGEIDMYDLMKAALRQRPEYIIVGEIRGREAYVLFQAMATGHATYSTVHADSAQSLIHRLEGKPINIPRVMLQSLDIVSLHVITRVKNKRARRCKQIIEIIDIDPMTKEILTNEVFRWDPVEDEFIYSGKSYVLERIRAEKDLSREEMTREIKNRKKIIEWMNANNLRGFREVAKLVAQYTENPAEAMKQINEDAEK